MPNTLQLSPVRRVAVGVSATAQGADGVGELTRTAYAALLATAWTDSDAASSVPVHDYAQALPAGDAWKACYGYDAAARTQRAACGAVCYSYAVPADALTGEPCNIVSVGALVTGDRYLEAGVDCHVVLSAAATPPTVATLAARTPDATLCATGSQTEPPNKRVGVTAELVVEPGAAATAYIHVALLLHDYTTARGAWIEGGAMLAVDPAAGDGGPTIEVEFSRSVTEDGPREVAFPTSLLSSGVADNSMLIAATNGSPVYASTIYGFMADVLGSSYVPANFANPQSKGLDIIYMPGMDLQADSKLTSSLLFVTPNDSAKFRRVGYSYRNGSTDLLAPIVTSVMTSAYMDAGFFGQLKISNAGLTWPLPAVMCVYAVVSPAFVRPGWGAVCQPSFWRAGATSFQSSEYSAFGEQLIWSSKPGDASLPAEFSVPAVPLLSHRFAEGDPLDGTFRFATPIHLDAGGYSTTLVASFRPDIGGTNNTANATIPATMALSLIRA